MPDPMCPLRNDRPGQAPDFGDMWGVETRMVPRLALSSGAALGERDMCPERLPQHSSYLCTCCLLAFFLTDIVALTVSVLFIEQKVILLLSLQHSRSLKKIN